MKESMKMIKSMGKEYILGQMEENMQENGKMEKDMEGVDISWQMVKVDRAYGKEIKG